MSKISLREKARSGMEGHLEFIIKNDKGEVVRRIRDKNVVKISAKEILSHRMPFNEVWNPVGGTGTGAWELTTHDLEGIFGVKYVLLGASFDEHGVPLDNEDPRYYVTDPVTGIKVPIRLGVGAEYGGGLINAVPIAEPDRPLKKIESVSFEPSAQPAGSPLLQSDVRTINNVVVLQTELTLDEYNGFGYTNSDYFTICEVALAAGKKIDHVGICNCDPHALFLDGHADGTPLLATANGTDVVTLEPTEEMIDLIRVGDQIKLTAQGGSAMDATDFDQVTPYYLVLNKLAGGRDILLDRVPANSSQAVITGPVGLYKDTLRIFSHRVLEVPLRKSSSYSIIVRWSIIFN